jgi:predicted RNA-binding protein with PUA-like domain
MAFWLFKQEPDVYPFQQFVQEGATLWDGVANNLALVHLRACKPGDRAFYYHTGKEKAIVGILEITGEPIPDPQLEDDKLVVVPVRPLEPLPRPVTLEELKADPDFAEWELIRISRLSIMPCSPERWAKILKLAQADFSTNKTKATKKPKKT